MPTHTPIGRSARPLLVFVALLAAACSAASGPHAFVAEGDQDSVRIGYSGDLDAAKAAARRYCAGYERVARFGGATMDTAYFDCVAQ